VEAVTRWYGRQVYVSWVLLLACAARCALAACPLGVDPETAQRLFQRVGSRPLPAGYRFEGIATNKSETLVRWSFDGAACPPVPVELEDCTPLFGLPPLQLHPPADFFTRCAGLGAVVRQLADARSRERRQPPRWAMARVLAAIAIIILSGLLFRHCGRAALIGIGAVVIALGLATPIVFDLPLAVTLELGTAWFAFAILLYDRQLLAANSRTRQLALLGLFLFSLLLHWSLASGGPGDLHLNLVGIWSPQLELRWGPAPVALFRLLQFVAGDLRDSEIVCINLILSGVLPILLYAILVQLDVHQRAALLAAVVTAAHPLLITFSGVLERQPTYLFAACGSTLALIGFLKNGAARRLLAFALGSVLATTSRPEGAHVLVVYAAVLLATPARRHTRAIATVTLAVLSVLALAYVHTALASPIPGNSMTLASRLPLLWSMIFDPDFTPLAWIAAWVLGMVVGIRRRAAWVALATVLGLDITWRWTGIYRMFVGHEHQIASARYELILLVPFAIGIALLIQALLETRPRWRLGLVAALVVFSAMTWRQPYQTLLRPFTVDYEYRFLKRQALALPAQARIYILDAPIDDIGFLDAQWVGQFAGSAVSVAAWSDRDCRHVRGAPDENYLYIGSSCAEVVAARNRQLPAGYGAWMRECAAMRAHVGGDAVEEIDVPARKMSWHEFKNSSVRLGLYRLSDPSACAPAPEP